MPRKYSKEQKSRWNKTYWARHKDNLEWKQKQYDRMNEFRKTHKYEQKRQEYRENNKELIYWQNLYYHRKTAGRMLEAEYAKVMYDQLKEQQNLKKKL